MESGGLTPSFFCAIIYRKEHHTMDKERLKLIVRNLELLVDGLKAEVYSDVDAYKKDMNYDEVARYVHDYDEVFEDSDLNEE